MLRLIVLCFLVLFSACKSSQKKASEAPILYVEQCFDSLRVYSIYSQSFNIDSLEQQVINTISDTTSWPDVLHSLESAIQDMDKHAYFLSKEKYEKLSEGHPDILPNPYPFQGKIIQDKYAFIALDGFLGVDSIAAKNYSDSLQSLLIQLHAQNPKGWIVDLRNNTGGWVYPMLAGLGPILGVGVKAMEIDNKGVSTDYFYFKTKENEETERILLSDSSFVFDTILPTAVLIGESTGSAGELMAFAFRGNPKTILIGMPSYGVSTGIHGFFMPDSTQICISNSFMTDRFGAGSQGGPIVPEIEVKNPVELFNKAFEWIENEALE